MMPRVWLESRDNAALEKALQLNGLLQIEYQPLLKNLTTEGTE